MPTNCGSRESERSGYRAKAGNLDAVGLGEVLDRERSDVVQIAFDLFRILPDVCELGQDFSEVDETDRCTCSDRVDNRERAFLLV